MRDGENCTDLAAGSAPNHKTHRKQAGNIHHIQGLLPLGGSQKLIEISSSNRWYNKSLAEGGARSYQPVSRKGAPRFYPLEAQGQRPLFTPARAPRSLELYALCHNSKNIGWLGLLSLKMERVFSSGWSAGPPQLVGRMGPRSLALVKASNSSRRRPAHWVLKNAVRRRPQYHLGE